MRNVDLLRYRVGRSAEAGDPTHALLAQLATVSLLRALTAIGVPLGRFLALYLWMGRAVGGTLAYFAHSLHSFIGWLSGTAFQRDTVVGRWWRCNYGLKVKRWHIGLCEW